MNSATSNATCYKDGRGTALGRICDFPAKVTPDGGISGIGVGHAHQYRRNHAYVFQTFVVLVVNSCLCILGVGIVSISRYFVLRTKGWSDGEMLLTNLTLALGDGQLFTSIAVSLAAIILRGKDSITAYHYNLVCYLGLAATSTSFITFLVLPSFTKKRWSNILRLLGYSLSMGFLCALLGPISQPFTNASMTFPGRAPADHTEKNSALVLQASCFTRNPAIPRDCRFSTDRRRFLFVSDVWGVTIMIVALMTSVSLLGDWEYYALEDTKRPHDLDDPERKSLRRKRLGFELVAVTITGAISIVSFWQFYDLRQYLNSSGWLSNNTELVVNSFGQLVPIFQVMAVLLLCVAAYDDYENKLRSESDAER